MERRKTRIVATIGPASNSRETIRGLIEAGVNVARMNFSHGTPAQHKQVLELIREEATKIGTPVAVFQDLCGPKIRISDIENDGIELIEKSEIKLAFHNSSNSKELGNNQCLYVETLDPAKVLKTDHRALLADGKIQLACLRVENNQAICIIEAGGTLRSRSGISFPDSKVKLSSLTEKDKSDVKWAVENQVDYIAQSFVGSTADVIELKELISEYGGKIPVIAKIERGSSLDDLSAIVGQADAVMVARGDLGLELPLERVPGAQKLIIETANAAGKPVITATQMLVSMVTQLRPTRAEVSDIYTAVRDGTDAVMLSEETAIGKHPIKAVEVLDKVLREAEKELLTEGYKPKFKNTANDLKVPDAICYAAANAAAKINAAAILACTVSGYTARLMAKYRPLQPLFGATCEKRTLNKMALYWGVEPVYINVGESDSTEDEVSEAMIAVRDRYSIKPGSRVIVTAGLRTKSTGTTDIMEIREIPRSK